MPLGNQWLNEVKKIEEKKRMRKEQGKHSNFLFGQNLIKIKEIMHEFCYQNKIKMRMMMKK